MTCIVGFTDKEKSITYMGGDSCASNCFSKNIINQNKVFKIQDTKNAILGFSGSVRDLNLLRYATGLIDTRDEPNIDEKYLVTKFIPNIIDTMEKGSRCCTSNGQKDMDSYFLFAYKDKMWRISMDYSIMSVIENYDAIGSGCYYALGSIASTEAVNMKPIDRIHKALQVASKFARGVEAPFYIINTENDEVIKFDE